MTAEGSTFIALTARAIRRIDDLWGVSAKHRDMAKTVVAILLDAAEERVEWGVRTTFPDGEYEDSWRGTRANADAMLAARARRGWTVRSDLISRPHLTLPVEVHGQPPPAPPTGPGEVLKTEELDAMTDLSYRAATRTVCGFPWDIGSTITCTLPVGHDGGHSDGGGVWHVLHSSPEGTVEREVENEAGRWALRAAGEYMIEDIDRRLRAGEKIDNARIQATKQAAEDLIRWADGTPPWLT